jgi:hypothetical protein
MNNLQENLDPTTGALLDENAKSKI